MTALRGLRGRLLLALVATSAVTLAVAAAITLGPLQSRLRGENESALQRDTEALREQFVDALASTAEDAERPEEELEELKAGHRDRAEQLRRDRRAEALARPANDLRARTGGARVLVADTSWTDMSGDSPDFLYDTYLGVPTEEALRIALRSLREDVPVIEFEGDELRYARPLRDVTGHIAGVVVAQRSVTSVSTAVKLVRNALLTAAAIGLAVAIGLGLTLSSTLTRRLGRLQRAALRISRDGPEAPAPTDRGRDEVGDLARALGRMQEELRRQEAARRSFVATASHELRTPLTMLQGTMELLDEDLRDGGDLADAREQVASARGALRRLAVLAGELLDLSRLDAAVQLRSEPVELGEIARAVTAEFELRAQDRNVALELVQAEDPVWARGDPAACARVVRILIDNALRYAPEGEPIEISTGRSRAAVTLQVSDRGPGVPEEEHEHIFERFHRGKATSNETGFGLGLAIGRELAERMGGALELAESDVGARFVLTLPPSPSSPAASPARDSAAAA